MGGSTTARTAVTKSVETLCGRLTPETLATLRRIAKTKARAFFADPRAMVALRNATGTKRKRACPPRAIDLGDTT